MKTDLELVIEQINNFREKVQAIAKIDTAQNNSEAFYKVLRDLGYSREGSSKGIFYKIIELLEKRISAVYLSSSNKDSVNYTFWFNFNTRNYSGERLGRLVNPKELAYRISRSSSSYNCKIEILDSQNKDDYNVYYFNKVIANGSKIKELKNDIVSVQELLSSNNNIELIKVFWDRPTNRLLWDIRYYGDSESHIFSNENLDLFKKGSKQLVYYTIFLKKTFNIPISENELPKYLYEGNDSFKGGESYIPSYLYICNLSTPFSKDYSGSVMFASDRDMDPLSIISEINSIKVVVSLITDIEAEYLNIKNKQFILRESIKSAVAAIMSRNMSHNLGSHYLYYTKATLEGIADISGNLSPDIRGAAKVISYIQSRMDYLATIISNDKYPYGSVNFKSQIWDELTIDDFSKRHYTDQNQLVLTKEAFKDKLRIVKNLAKKSSNLEKSYLELLQNTNGSDIFEVPTNLGAKILSDTDKIGNYYNEISKRTVYERTTNFLLTNIIFSEDYTRPGIISSEIAEGKNSLRIYAGIWNDAKGVYDLFTGTDNAETSKGRTMKDEEHIKTLLSRIDLALPGGTMSCHAFFNILENFIRNSAKYSWSKRNKRKDLIFVVALKISHTKHTVECTIYDNKRDAYKIRDKETLIHNLKKRLSELIVVGENNVIDKENKGLKEMLFSTVWLRANEFDESLASIFTKIQLAPKSEKLKLITDYAFEIVSVDQNGLPCSKSSKSNLGIRFTLPLFRRSERLVSKKMSNLLRLHTDVIDVSSENNSSKRIVLGRSYEDIFPRICNVNVTNNLIEINSELVLEKKDKDKAYDVQRLKSAINNNLGNIDNYLLTICGLEEPRFANHKINHDHTIYFDTHFSTQITKVKLKEDYYGKFAYVDTVSGNNFSKTLAGMYQASIIEKGGAKYFSEWTDMYLSLKIKEAALTRIVIIDERLFNNVKWVLKSEKMNNGQIDIRNSAYELSMRNIRVLNFNEFLNSSPNLKKKRKNKLSLPENPLEPVCDLPFLHGNSFLPTGPFADFPDGCNFLTIHLGIIEKILKSDVADHICGEKGDKPLSEERVNKFMQLLVSTFGLPDKQGKKHLHICIHSGRGNYSSELSGPLKEYPFISLAALEISFNNSKHLLSQLFYNTIYIGKGEVNKEQLFDKN